MHEYSTDTIGRHRIIIAACVLIAIGGAYGLGVLYERVGFTPPWWLDAPAIFGCYAAIWRIYDQFVWRWTLFGRTVSGIDDYSGEWSGMLHSNYARNAALPIELSIKQTSSRILVEVRTETSNSYSNMAMACSSAGRSKGLRYTYSNEPRAFAALSMSPHSGIAEIQLSADRTTLSGQYENNRHRGTYGTIRAMKVILHGGNSPREGSSS